MQGLLMLRALWACVYRKQAWWVALSIGRLLVALASRDRAVRCQVTGLRPGTGCVYAAAPRAEATKATQARTRTNRCRHTSIAKLPVTC